MLQLSPETFRRIRNFTWLSIKPRHKPHSADDLIPLAAGRVKWARGLLFSQINQCGLLAYWSVMSLRFRWAAIYSTDHESETKRSKTVASLVKLRPSTNHPPPASRRKMYYVCFHCSLTHRATSSWNYKCTKSMQWGGMVTATLITKKTFLGPISEKW